MKKRSMASSIIERFKTPEAIWKVWTVRNAVREGYKVSSWVFKCVNMISKNGSSVPWHVETLDGEVVENHPVSNVLNNPNKAFSRQDLFELLLAWLQLSGESYIKTIEVDGKLAELWPISPDRITPVASTEAGELVSHYAILNENNEEVVSQEFTKDNIVPIRYIDPADPMRGIGPLQVVAKAVDVDLEQLAWNKAAMQNRGVLDGVFTFKKDLDQATGATYRQRIKEMFAGKREIGVIGSEATYQRLSLTPTEMDFIVSRKFNREEIFVVFGVPLALGGVQEGTTFNNVQGARVIFWESTLIPILDDMKNSLNMHLRKYLADGLVINYDLSNVPALKKDQKEKAETAKLYTDMGVPVEQVNEMFTLGIPEYKGWDISNVNNSKQTKDTNTENRGAKSGLMLKKTECRSVQDEMDLKERLAKKAQPEFTKALRQQKVAVFNAIKDETDINGAIFESQGLLLTTTTKHYKKVAIASAGTVIVDERGTNVNFETRAIDPNINGAIDELILTENITLTELSLINKTTTELVIAAVIDGQEENKTIAEIQQSILDSGTFSPDRALRIARTISGTGQSIGQLVGAETVGATSKTWHKGGFDSRLPHQARDLETVGINEKFSRQFPTGAAPRYPLDQNIAAGDRINCTCSMTFGFLLVI